MNMTFNRIDSSCCLKHELVLTLMSTLFKNDIDNSTNNLMFLNALDISELDEMLGNYYLFKNKNTNEIS